ncbi:sugar transferase [Ramlibacter sp.]|uniref:sugar transferase n=1 Tax=Ramlibacter sp. TaxID=1917967 RepID=UPI0026194CC5|nr:sugar transferase [Ramlibacter sp.]MDB5957077.1 UDP-phosphate galactose phosphotransferase [Ramlibacter sp.]
MYRVNDEFLEGSMNGLRDRAGAQSVRLSRVGAGAKRLLDLMAAVTFFVLFLPLFAVVAIGVRLTSPGPIFYAQDRIGQEGRTFRFYKFRSMLVDSDEVLSSFLDSDAEAKSEWDTYQKLERDPRITWFGKFIRRTSLDELPQFVNVLLGDMSLVGPRPCLPSQKSLYGKHWKVYCAVKPGLTGLWQVSGRNWLTYEQRVQLDAKYVKNWSLWLDSKIMLRTISVVLTGNGSR